MKAKLNKFRIKSKSDFPSSSGGGMSVKSPLSITDSNFTPGHPTCDRATALNASISAKKQTIACDFAELTVKNTIKHLEPGEAPPLEINLPGVRLVTASKDAKGNPIIIGTKHYQVKYNAFFENEAEPFATVLTYPRKGGILPDYLSQIKVENRELYATGWSARLLRLLSALRVEINNFSRLDIAIDSNCVGNDPLLGLYYTSPFIGLYKRWKAGMDNVGRAVYNQEHAVGRATTGFDWGKKSASKYLTAYVKSDRIEADDKGYIADFWNLNGIEPGQPVERMELKLKTDAIKRTLEYVDGLADEKNIGVDITRLENPTYLAGIMRAHLKGWFEFVVDQPDTNKTRRDNYETIDWHALDAELLGRIPTTKPKNEVWAAKHAISKGLRDSNKEYSHKAAKEAVADAIADGGAMCDEAVVKAVQTHLRDVFPYTIPAHCFTGLAPILSRAIGDQVSRVISDQSAKQFNIGIYSGMAKAHKLEDFFNKKARAYGI
jgi:hypothetical protein